MTLGQSLAVLKSEACLIRAYSRFFQTPCFPPGAGPDYVNAVCLVETRYDPEGLLCYLHRIEQEFGRLRVERWGQRTLDLDLLAFDAVLHPDRATVEHWMALPLERQKREAPDQLIVPHPRLQDRAFVLGPMADIVPDWHHPVTGRRVDQMLADLPASDHAELKPL